MNIWERLFKTKKEGPDYGSLQGLTGANEAGETGLRNARQPDKMVATRRGPRLIKGSVIIVEKDDKRN